MEELREIEYFVVAEVDSHQILEVLQTLQVCHFVVRDVQIFEEDQNLEETQRVEEVV